jgi:hypothetical protein
MVKMQQVATRTATWATATLTTALVLGFCSTPASADAIATQQANQAAAEVQAVTGTVDVIPASHSPADANSAAVAHVDGATVDVPKDPEAGVTVDTPSGQEIGVGIPNADTARNAKTSVAGTTVYADPSSDSATAVQATTNGMRQLFTLSSPEAATDVVVPLTLPSNTQLVANEDGGYDIVTQSGDSPAVTIASIGAPWAKDATGKSLPTSYTLNGDQLTQHIDTAEATYPVVADPHYTGGWVSGTIYFNKTETKLFLVGAGVANFISTFSGPWAPIIRSYLTIITAVAGTAAAKGQCVSVNSYGFAHVYSGNQGGGYCR